MPLPLPLRGQWKQRMKHVLLAKKMGRVDKPTRLSFVKATMGSQCLALLMNWQDLLSRYMIPFWTSPSNCLIISFSLSGLSLATLLTPTSPTSLHFTIQGLQRDSPKPVANNYDSVEVLHHRSHTGSVHKALLGLEGETVTCLKGNIQGR